MEKSIQFKGANFLKLGKDIFVLRKVNHSLDIDEEIKGYYKKQAQDLGKETIESFCSGINADFHSQVQHLEKANSRYSITINPDLYDKGVYYNSDTKTILKIEPAIYHPTIFTGTKAMFRNRGLDTDGTKFDSYADNDTLEITFKNKFSPLALLVGFDDKTSTVYTLNLRTFHSYSNYSLCIGNSPYNEYSKLKSEAISDQISKVNLFSLASSLISSDIVDSIYHLSDIIKYKNISKITKEGASQWETE